MLTLPAASRARADSVCVVLVAVRVSQVTVYGLLVTSAPSGAPSSRNCTPVTPSASVAVAVTVIELATVVPAAGP